MVSSTDFVRVSERPTAIATLNRQRHLTPSCGGFTPTAELGQLEKQSNINDTAVLCPRLCHDGLRITLAQRRNIPGRQCDLSRCAEQREQDEHAIAGRLPDV